MSWSNLPPGNRYIYPLDDVYIHLALSRNFAQLGVWSVNTSGFDSASSSILYTLLLAFFIKIFGDWEYYPLLINISFGIATVYAVFRYFRDFYGKKEMWWIIGLLLPYSMLYLMVLYGMEHTMHLFLMVMAIYFIKKNTDSNFPKKDFIILLVIIFLQSMIRYESMFFTVALSFALALRTNFWKALLVLSVGFLPIIIFGIISEKQGGFFFPNSVMIKGSYPNSNQFIKNCWTIVKNGIFLNTSFYKCLFFPYLIFLIYLVEKYKNKTISVFFRNEVAIITIAATGIMHSLFAFLKYRYENYIMIGTLLLLIPIIVDFVKNFKGSKYHLSFISIIKITSILAIVLVSMYRLVYHHIGLQYASKGINEQQIEMSRFLATYYKNEKVVANDIGAVAYYSHVQLFDMVGLGSTNMTRLRVANKKNKKEVYINNSKKYITEYTKKNHYKIAIIYPEWFPGSPPKNWIPVASWTIPQNYGPAIRRIVFYAIDANEVKNLQKNLSKFNLNPEVQQWYYIHH